MARRRPIARTPGTSSPGSGQIAVRAVPASRSAALAPGLEPSPRRCSVLAARTFDDEAVAPGVLAGVRLRLHGPLEVAAAVGWIAHGSFVAGPGSVSVDELPAQAGALASWRLGRVELGAEARARLGVLLVSGRDLDANASTVGTGLRAGVTAWAGVEIVDRLWIASSLAGLWLILGHDIVVDGVGTVAREAPLSVEWTLGLGYRAYR